MDTITFYGAAGSVTGSRHLLELDGKRILLDCGFFQGLPDVRERNRTLPFRPESIDAVVLSHAHIDHSGMLPVLVRRGFTGSIYTTPATADVVLHMLQDAAQIERQDAEYRQKHNVGSPDEREPLFTEDDVTNVMSQIVEVPYVRERGKWHKISEGIALKLYDAGHILGSAVSVVKYSKGGTVECFGYTGDLGPTGMPLLYDPQVPKEEISTFLLESTYGSRTHEPIDQSLDRLATTIRQVCERKGKIIVPAFSLGRTQVFIYIVHKLTDEGKIPRFPIFVDSPLATDITDVYRRHRHIYDKQTQKDFEGEGHKPLAFRDLTYTRSVQESKQLNIKKGPFMVISASGMMTAGRVVHHLRRCISDSRNAIFITGYQAEGTLGRRILEGARRVELYGDWFDVRADVYLFNEFSAHADAPQLQAYAEHIRGLQKVVLVHGEPHQADDLKDQLIQTHPEWHVIRPQEGDIVEL